MSNVFDSDSPTNLAEYSVSELSGSIKRTVETAFDQVRVRGEISGYRGPHSSGHAYFSLKDDRARIDAVIWKGVFSRLRFRPVRIFELFEANGGLPLGKRAPARQRYRLVELQRWREERGLPLNLAPKFFPVDIALSDRCAIAIV